MKSLCLICSMYSMYNCIFIMQNTKIKDVLHTYKIYIQIGHTLTNLFIVQTYLKGSVFDVV